MVVVVVVVAGYTRHNSGISGALTNSGGLIMLCA